jgi:hypothetical protein
VRRCNHPGDKSLEVKISLILLLYLLVRFPIGRTTLFNCECPEFTRENENSFEVEPQNEPVLSYPFVNFVAVS